jgi:hypothetical protein
MIILILKLNKKMENKSTINNLENKNTNSSKVNDQVKKDFYGQRSSSSKEKVNIEEIFNLKNKEYNTLTEESISIYDFNEEKCSGIAIITNYAFNFRTNKYIEQYMSLKHNPEKLQQLDIKFKTTFYNKFYKIPFFLISKLDKYDERTVTNYETGASIYQFNFEIQTKDGRTMKFCVESSKNKFYEKLHSKAFPKKSNKEYMIYAMEYCQSKKISEEKIDGWSIYNPEAEFKRQKLDEERFVLSDINRNFDVCQTYPEHLVMPRNFNREKVVEAASFRTKNRFPVVCYYWSNYKTAILRSSQTKSGLLFISRNEYDEKYLECFRKESETLDIYDARPYLNAFAMKVSI